MFWEITFFLELPPDNYSQDHQRAEKCTEQSSNTFGLFWRSRRCPSQEFFYWRLLLEYWHFWIYNLLVLFRTISVKIRYFLFALFLVQICISFSQYFVTKSFPLIRTIRYFLLALLDEKVRIGKFCLFNRTKYIAISNKK